MMSRNIDDEEILDDLMKYKSELEKRLAREVQAEEQCCESLGRLQERVDECRHEIKKIDRLIGLFGNGQE